MEKSNPAFARARFSGSESQVGLTKREYAAIAIMAGFGADPHCQGGIQDKAKWAVQWADALLSELEK